MSLVTPAQVKGMINTALSDLNLQDVIERVEAQIEEKIGAPWSGDSSPSSVTRGLRGGDDFLYLPTEIHAITSITEDGTALGADDYEAWGGGVIAKASAGARWGRRCVVVYQPADDRKKRTQVIIDLVRLVLERTALQQEDFAGEYAYTAPDNWEAEFRKAMKRLTFQAI